MKIFISADIEGVAGISHWDEASLHKPDFSIFQEQMTAEVNAACEGALEAGATEIWVKDGHGTGRNLLASRLPPPTRLIRGWSGHPYQMLQELDETFSAVVMIGYHAAAGAAGNPLSHVLTKGLAELRINGRHASEFLLNAYTAALLKVPVALVSGDQALCDNVVAVNPSIQTVPVKIGVGDSTVSLHPGEAVRRIREQVAHALQTDLTSCGLDLPEQFRVELRYKEHTDAYRNAFYPGAKLKDACIIVFETPDYFEVLRFLLFTAGRSTVHPGAPKEHAQRAQMHPINLLTYSDVMAASERIAGHAHRTPVLTSRTADNLLGCELFLKAENFQRMGAFKFRGAFNALSRFDASQRRQGVVAFSSGNHAQAIALSAKILGIPATIIMPHDAPVMKVEATKSYGAQVLTYNRYEEDREQISRKLAEQQGMTLIPPYDHADVIAGQGTVVKELIEEVGPRDALFVPLGGGGLLSGSALSARALSPLCQIYGVEPEAGNDGQQSFQTGSIVHIDTPNSIADGAQTQHLGQLTFAIIREKVHDVLTVSDDDLVHEMRFFATRMKILVEPTGCLGFAGARVSSEGLRGKRVGVVISGGNVDLSRFCALTSKGGRSQTDPI